MSEGTPIHPIFTDPEWVSRYTEGPGRAVPGFATLHRMVLQLLGERVGATARVLVLGAGGGMELLAFAQAQPGWTFAGIDPSGLMLEEARKTLGELGERVELTEGYIPDAPAGPFDAATCLLTMHLVPDDGHKLEALQAIHARLVPGAPFVIVDNCIDLEAADSDQKIERFTRFALNGGVEPSRMEEMKAALRTSLHPVSAEREEALLVEAGFTGVELFFAGLSWRGWVAYA